MSSELTWLQLHATALFLHDRAGRIVMNNAPDYSPPPRLFLGRSSAGALWRFRHDLSPALAAALEQALRFLSGDESLDQLAAAVTPVLEHEAPVENTFRGIAWHFPDRLPPVAGGACVRLEPGRAALLEDHFPFLIAELAASQPCLARIEDGVAVSVCRCSRVTGTAVEAGLETAPAYRGRGYGLAVTTAWARAVRAHGRIPLYSAAHDNTASLRVATKLGLISSGETLSLG